MLFGKNIIVTCSCKSPAFYSIHWTTLYLFTSLWKQKLNHFQLLQLPILWLELEELSLISKFQLYHVQQFQVKLALAALSDKDRLFPEIFLKAGNFQLKSWFFGIVLRSTIQFAGFASWLIKFLRHERTGFFVSNLPYITC